MKTLFQSLFWALIIFSAVSVENASLNQIAIEALFIVFLIWPAFYFEDMITYLSKPQ